MFRVAVVALVLSGCVSKKNHTAALDAAASAQADLSAQISNLEEALANAEATNASLTEVTETLDRKNATQAEQLEQLSERLANLSANNAAQREEKAELEALLTQVQEDMQTAEDEAQAARERAAELAEERERIEEERARLAAENTALEQRTAEYDALVEELESEIDAGEVVITELSGKLTVNMSDAILFDSGKTAIKTQGVEALTRVAGVLASSVGGREVRVEGHTDNVPVGAGAPYADNWALSSLRASNVVALLVEQGVDPLNIASVGYGEHRPAASNDSAASRAMNRRIEIVLVPKLRTAERTARTAE